MKFRGYILTCILIFTAGFSVLHGASDRSKSVYQLMPVDTSAYYFTPANYNFKADGKSDVSDALQAAINQVKTENNYGILFIPEGKYIISKTIYIPGSVRLIGYGLTRPEFILAKNSPGYQTLEENSRYQEK